VDMDLDFEEVSLGRVFVAVGLILLAINGVMWYRWKSQPGLKAITVYYLDEDGEVASEEIDANPYKFLPFKMVGGTGKRILAFKASAQIQVKEEITRDVKTAFAINVCPENKNCDEINLLGWTKWTISAPVQNPPPDEIKYIAFAEGMTLKAPLQPGTVYTDRIFPYSVVFKTSNTLSGCDYIGSGNWRCNYVLIGSAGLGQTVQEIKDLRSGKYVTNPDNVALESLIRQQRGSEVLDKWTYLWLILAYVKSGVTTNPVGESELVALPYISNQYIIVKISSDSSTAGAMEIVGASWEAKAPQMAIPAMSALGGGTVFLNVLTVAGVGFVALGIFLEAKRED